MNPSNNAAPRVVAFSILSRSISDECQQQVHRHCDALAQRYGFLCEEFFSVFFYIITVTDGSTIARLFSKQNFKFNLGGIEGLTAEQDRFLRVSGTGDRVMIESDYAGSIPVYYSFRGGLSLSNVEPCVFLATNSSLEDISIENLYGFLRYSHFIWDETAWKHIYQMLPDARFVFSNEGKLLEDCYLATVRADNSRDNYTDRQVADELCELNRKLVTRSLSDAEEIILPLSAGYDSRMIFSVIAENPVLQEKVSCYTYGSSASLEVQAARRLTQLKGVAWHHIDLPCEYLRKNNLQEIADIFGSSMHMHGMYQIEFFNEIKKHLTRGKEIRLTSGFMTGVPAGQHNGLLEIDSESARLSDVMNRFPQSKIWRETDLSSMPVFEAGDYQELAESRFRKAFNRFEGAVYQKAVMFDIWTRQRNFISYYPRTFEWLCPVVSPHMCAEYANYFLSLSREHLWDRNAVELMFKLHYQDIAKIASNSNGINAISSKLETSLFLLSKILRQLKMSKLLPPSYRNASFEFNLQAVKNCGKEAAYPLLEDDPEISAFLANFGGKENFHKLYRRADNGDVQSYARLITFQAVVFNCLSGRSDQ